MCWLAGAVHALPKQVYELKELLVERTERERQSYLGKILDEMAEKYITQEQLKNAHAGDLERDRVEAAQMRDMLSNASSEYRVVIQGGSERQSVHLKTNEKLCEVISTQEEIQVARSADVEHGFLEAKELQDMLSADRPEQAGLDVKTIEFPQAQTIEKIVAQFHEDIVGVIQLAP